MNYYAAKELAESFRTVRKNTLTIAEDISEEKYSFRPAPDTAPSANYSPTSRSSTTGSTKVALSNA